MTCILTNRFRIKNTLADYVCAKYRLNIALRIKTMFFVNINIDIKA